MLHLDSGPRYQWPLCGSTDDEVTCEINDVECKACVAEHDALCEEAAA